MNDILIIHPDRAEVEPLFELLKPPEYHLSFSPTISDQEGVIGNNEMLLVLLSTALQEADALDYLKKNKALFKNNLMLLNFGKDMDYLLEGLAQGALSFFDIHFNPNEIRTLLNLFFKNRLLREKFHFLQRNIVSERKELSLSNLDIYDSNRVNLILGYITDSIKPLFAPEDYLGLSNGLYEMLINAVEHGNLGIDSEEKEQLLDAGTYAEILSKKVRENLQPVHVLLTNDREKIVIQITDQGKGFDHRARVEGKKELTLSGRGISIARHYFDEVNYSGTGNSVALVKYLKPLAK